MGQRGPLFLEIILYYFNFNSFIIIIFIEFFISQNYKKFPPFLITYLETKNQFQHTANNTNLMYMYVLHAIIKME